jgi:hypothetical protein
MPVARSKWVLPMLQEFLAREELTASHVTSIGVATACA